MLLGNPCKTVFLFHQYDHRHQYPHQWSGATHFPFFSGYPHRRWHLSTWQCGSSWLCYHLCWLRLYSYKIWDHFWWRFTHSRASPCWEYAWEHLLSQLEIFGAVDYILYLINLFKKLNPISFFTSSSSLLRRKRILEFVAYKYKYIFS